MLGKKKNKSMAGEGVPKERKVRRVIKTVVKRVPKAAQAKASSAPVAKKTEGDPPSAAREQSGEAFDLYAQRCSDVDRKRLETMCVSPGEVKAPETVVEKPKSLNPKCILLEMYLRSRLLHDPARGHGWLGQHRLSRGQ